MYSRYLIYGPFVDQNNNRYETLGAAGQFLGISPAGICMVLKGKLRATRGYTFQYLDPAP